MSKFWTALHKLTGIKLKLSSAYHPQTNGASEQTNKIVNQALQYHVAQNQKGWACALPHIRFDLMNTMNKSTGFSPFNCGLGEAHVSFLPSSCQLCCLLMKKFIHEN